jgi:hypothetical protein
MDNKRQIVHVNRLKRAHNIDAWRPKQGQTEPKKGGKKGKTQRRGEEEEEIKMGSIPMLRVRPAEAVVEQSTPAVPVMDTPDMGRIQTDTPLSERRDPSYEPPETPRSRRELQTTRPDPPITRSRARLQTQDLPVETRNGTDDKIPLRKDQGT